MLNAQYIEVGGVLSYVESAGTGPTVLCLHTAGQSGVQWRYVTEELAELGYRVVVPDLPGHGRSEPYPGGPVDDLGVYAQWCGELLDILEAQEPYVVGCSIGGKIALEMAVQRGDRLSGIVAMAAHGGTIVDGQNISASGLRRELEDAAAPSRTDRTYLGTLAVVGQSIPAERAELIARMHRREDPEVSNSDLLGWANQDLRNELSSVACPAHVVVGSDDLWLNPNDAQRTADLIPRSKYTFLEGIGHYPMEEIDGFAAQLHEWLDELPLLERNQLMDSSTDQQPETLLSAVHQLVTQQPGAPMLLDACDTGTTIVTRQQVWNRTVALQQELKRQGVGVDDCVAVWLPNWSDAVVWQVAVASLGAHVIGMNTRYNTAEIAHVLTMTRPKVVAVAHGFLTIDFRGRLHEAVQQVEVDAPSVALVTGPNGSSDIEEETIQSYDVGAGVWTPATPTCDMPTEMPNDAESPDKLVVAFTTSGSTGMPKLAAHTSYGVLHHAQSVATKAGLSEGKVNLAALPLSGVFGFAPAYAALVGGGAVLLEPIFDEHLIVKHMAEHNVTHVVGGDDIIGRIVSAWKDDPQDLSTLESVLIADLHGRATELSHTLENDIGAVVAGVYGSSELFALASFWPADEPHSTRWTGGGRPVSELIEVRAADPVTGEVMPAGEEGELQFRGPNVVDAYLGNEAAFEASFSSDGWFRSGDLGSVSADNAIHYTSRLGDVLRLRGFLVAPAEIEARLIEHEAVETVKVVGRTIETGETQAVGFVILKEGAGAEEDELRQWCAQTLAGFKVPQRVYLIDEMPTTVGTNGTKIRAKELRKLAQDFYDKEKVNELQG